MKNTQVKKRPAIRGLAKQIYQTITKQSFFDWYNDGGRFCDHIEGNPDPNVPSKEEILKDIIKMFRLEK